jgi:hypothetical protein
MGKLIVTMFVSPGGVRPMGSDVVLLTCKPTGEPK